MAGTTKSVVREVIQNLAAHLKIKVPSLKEVFDDFPNANQKLNHPSGAISTGQPTFMRMQHRMIYKGPVSDTHQALVARTIGEWRFSLQLDIWVDNKFDRHDMMQRIFDALTPEKEVNGFSIRLSNYYDQYCRYTVGDFNYLSDEASIQRNEWRVKFSIMAEVPAVREAIENIIESVENTLEVSSTAEIAEPEPQPGNGFLVTLF